MPSKWATFHIRDWPDAFYAVRRGPGCYAIFGDDKLVYIGESRDVHNRMYFHRVEYHPKRVFIKTPWGRFRDLKVKVRYSKKLGDWAMVEIRLIHRLNPPGNTRGRSDGKKSKWLKRRKPKPFDMSVEQFDLIAE